MKKIISILVLLVVAFSVFAQAGKETTVQPVLTVEPEKPETIVVYAKVPTDWKFTNIWAWENASGKNAFDGANWPGIPMIPDVNNQGWYYIYVPGYVDIVIINGQCNGSDVQTDGIEIKGNNNLCVINQNDQISGNYLNGIYIHNLASPEIKFNKIYKIFYILNYAKSFK